MNVAMLETPLNFTTTLHAITLIVTSNANVITLIVTSNAKCYNDKCCKQR